MEGEDELAPSVQECKKFRLLSLPTSDHVRWGLSLGKLSSWLPEQLSGLLLEHREQLSNVNAAARAAVRSAARSAAVRFAATSTRAAVKAAGRSATRYHYQGHCWAAARAAVRAPTRQLSVCLRAALREHYLLVEIKCKIKLLSLHPVPPFSVNCFFSCVPDNLNSPQLTCPCPPLCL